MVVRPRRVCDEIGEDGVPQERVVPQARRLPSTGYVASSGSGTLADAPFALRLCPITFRLHFDPYLKRNRSPLNASVEGEGHETSGSFDSFPPFPSFTKTKRVNGTAITSTTCPRKKSLDDFPTVFLCTMTELHSQAKREHV